MKCCWSGWLSEDLSPSCELPHLREKPSDISLLGVAQLNMNDVCDCGHLSLSNNRR